MTARSVRERQAIDPACPDDLRQRLYAEIAGSLSGKGIKAGERLADVVERHCPHVYSLAEADGFRLVLTSRKNTHKALCQGRLTIEIRRAPRH